MRARGAAPGELATHQGGQDIINGIAASLLEFVARINAAEL
jgi:hypothetical protein